MSSFNSPVIVWFRQDLRLADNPALFFAGQKGTVIPIFIDDRANNSEWSPGAASCCWLHHSLDDLNHQLDGCLKLFQGEPLSILIQLIKETGANTVVWNRCYTPHAIRRDTNIKERLLAEGIEVASFNGSLLWEPWEIYTKSGTPYKVFTPYYRKGCLNAKPPQTPVSKPKLQIHFSEDSGQQLALDQLKLLPEHSWANQITDHWSISEASAWALLHKFTEERLKSYSQNRDFPAKQATSSLSPYLRWGQISPRQVWHYSQQQCSTPGLEHPLDTFLKEIAWREFSYYQLYHSPSMTEENLNQKFNRFPWRHHKESCQTWQRGQTGFPIIDAGMRELWQTGYMHNRVRMLVASFLVKNQLQHWHNGARWFWDTLVDADLASNSASWQWVAGCGNDAAPYFRIFNPVVQGIKFDPQGEYVRRYIPELNNLPDCYIHTPWDAPESILLDAQVTLGTTYPQPILDLNTTRKRALSAYTELKKLPLTEAAEDRL
ncbi:cryptochrome/photolyase family protein [Amphritea japonica]|uniref:Deoxyribodipyrimidine photo-lyase n=1 Tax=Amphritea japonica ATCC BAA-1530 TaxID=1278309 RepID=A0A7R6PHQ3_9GAMM|nr:deoxyribodipyrimidine photo-lyase [Amphritea japonica]BBB26742.1 deoxyribodipyrimidine photo-lyase [Amphritea japonica ATCC BAA-1530]